MWNRGQIQGHLGRFDFSGSEVQRRASSLSGGERARVALALMMLSDANLLVFDEPTNHLDVESIEALEDALENYEGSVILVTHDRALLAALATRIWSFDDATLTDYPGDFAEWEADVAGKRQGHAAARAVAARRGKARQDQDALRHLDAAHRRTRAGGCRDARSGCRGGAGAA